MKARVPAFPEIGERIERADGVLLALDFDGTLCPIVDSPSNADAGPEMSTILSKLIAPRSATVAIITGRASADIRRRVPPRLWPQPIVASKSAGAVSSSNTPTHQVLLIAQN